MMSSGIAGKINLCCLLAIIFLILVQPIKKEIWYDETVSILCSKGFSHATPDQLTNTTSITSTALNQLNTAGNVFTATVVDNSNSFLYNIGLHWFTMLFGNNIGVYMLFTKLCGIALMISFFVLCNLLFNNGIFTSLALVLLGTDNTIIGMSHEIRAYEMGAFFVTLAAVFFYKFMYQKEKPLYLFFTGLFSVAAVLSHFLSVYIVLVFLLSLLFVKRSTLFSPKNLLAMLVPVSLIAVFFFFASRGLQVMSRQNEHIQLALHGFSAAKVLLGGMKFTAINFKAVFPAYSTALPVVAVSFLFIISLYISALRVAADETEKRNLHLLFILGLSGSLFLTMLCFKSHHYTALYFRYFSFCIPFCSLFTAYAVYVFFRSTAVNKLVKAGLLLVILLPSVLLFSLFLYRSHAGVKYNHTAIADRIMKDKVLKLEVPEWSDALLVQAMLPQDYKIEYIKNPIAPYFTLHTATTEEKVQVIRINE